MLIRRVNTATVRLLGVYAALSVLTDIGLCNREIGTLDKNDSPPPATTELPGSPTGGEVSTEAPLQISSLPASSPTQTSSEPKDSVHTSEPLPTWQEEICEIEIKSDAIQAFEIALKEKSIFVFINMNIKSNNSIYEEESDYIDPFAWVWALQGKGYILLNYPYDFEYLSLKTLSIGVYHMDLDVPLPEDECFQRANDSQKESILASYIMRTVNESSGFLNENDASMYLNKEYRVCQEKINTEHHHTNGWLYDLDTMYDCYSSSSEGLIHIDNTEKHKWPKTVENFTYVAVLFLPLTLFLFLQRNPPKEQEGKKYLAINSDLPVGVHYTLFHTYSDNEWAVGLRLILGLVIFMFLGTLLYAVPLWAYKDLFIRHTHNSGWPIYAIVHVVFISISVIFGILFLVTGCSNDGNKIDSFEKFKESEVFRFENYTKKWLAYPKRPIQSLFRKENSMFKIILLIIKQYYCLLFKPRCWMTCPSILFTFPFCLPLIQFYWMCFIHTADLFAIAKPECTARYVFRVLMYLLFNFVWSVTVYFNACFFLFFLFDIIVYTYTGLLVNYDYYLSGDGLPTIIAAVGGVIAFINFYHKYVRLHRITMKKASKLQKALTSKEKDNIIQAEGGMECQKLYDGGTRDQVEPTQPNCKTQAHTHFNSSQAPMASSKEPEVYHTYQNIPTKIGQRAHSLRPARRYNSHPDLGRQLQVGLDDELNSPTQSGQIVFSQPFPREIHMSCEKPHHQVQVQQEEACHNHLRTGQCAHLQQPQMATNPEVQAKEDITSQKRDDTALPCPQEQSMDCIPPTESLSSDDSDDSSSSDESMPPDQQEKNECLELREIVPTQNVQYRYKYINVIDDIPHVSQHLFKSTYKTFQPISGEIVNIMVMLILVSLIATFSIKTVKSIGEEMELAPYAKALVAFLTIGIFPFLQKLISSDEKLCREKAFALRIENFLKTYTGEEGATDNARMKQTHDNTVWYV